ncbi:MAG: efflux RND transporter periplasmic adaptor subunit [Bacteroidia bacterium]
MKNQIITYLSIFALFVVSCQPPSGNGDLETLKTELKGLETQRKDLDDKIKDIEEKIAQLDTTIEETVQTLVTVTMPETKTFTYKVSVPGVADSRQNIVVGAESMGNVTKIFAREGNMVRKGQTIASIDSEVMYTQIAELKTRLELADELFEKQKRLWEKKIGSEVQYLQAKNNKESLEQSIKSLQAQASKSNITAPFTGYLDEVFLREGQTINMGQPAVRIVDLSVIKLSADVSEKYIGQFSVNDTIEISFPSVNKKFKVKIDNIGQVVSSDNRTFSIEAIINNEDGAIKPNVLADVTIPVYNNPNALTLPTSLIQQGKSSDYVFVVVDGEKGLEARKRNVKVGRSYKGKSEIVDGVTKDDQIVSLGSRQVADGEPLKIQKQ